MGLLAHAYDMPEGNENRLSFWLSMDEWGIAEATQIIADIDPDQSLKSGTPGNVTFSWITLFNGHQVPELDDEGFPLCTCHNDDCGFCGNVKEELYAYSLKCKDLSRLLSKRSENMTFSSPKFWIERALSKKIEIPWLDWARERGLLPDGLAITTMKPSNTTEEKPLTTKERDTYLTIIAALCDYSAIAPTERGAAAQIAKMTDEVGAPVTDDTVRKVLSKIPDALERRKK